MPLYEYRCTRCGCRFEVLRRVGQDKADLACPECGRAEIEKEYSTFAGSVAGSGSSGSGCAPGGRFT